MHVMIVKNLFGDHAGLAQNGVVMRFGYFLKRACLENAGESYLGKTKLYFR